MQTVFSHVIRKRYSQEYENIATDALAYILESSEAARAELLAAAVKRHEVVSGWDLVEGKPKTARRVVPIGSVYWFQQVEGSEEDRRAWSRNVLEQGWWPSETMSVEDRRRQSEGFNNVLLGNWARAASWSWAMRRRLCCGGNIGRWGAGRSDLCASCRRRCVIWGSGPCCW